MNILLQPYHFVKDLIDLTYTKCTCKDPDVNPDPCFYNDNTVINNK
jgi:hypothetical protein